jgi:hypothetical protein
MPSHIPSDYKFTLKEKRKSPSGHLLYIWAAIAPPTACANAAYLSAYRAAARASESEAKVLHLLALLVQVQILTQKSTQGWEWRVVDYNVSNDCSSWHNSFLDYEGSAPAASVFDAPGAQFTCFTSTPDKY